MNKTKSQKKAFLKWYKSKGKKYYKNYYRKNRKRILKYLDKYRQKNKKKLFEYEKNYREKNREKINKRMKKYRTRKNKYEVRRRKNNLQARLKHVLRNRLHSCIKNKIKSNSALILLGCSIHKLKQYIEKQFTNKMTWKNYGKYWEIDHIRPCCTFDLSKKSEQRKCFHYTNLRPLEISMNRRRNKK